MNQDEIYTKVITKALENGYIPFPGIEKGFEWKFENGNMWIKTKVFDFKTEKTVENVHARNIEGVIFSHDFAKAFWGEESYLENLGVMSRAVDRASFLSIFLKEELSPEEVQNKKLDL